MSKPYVRLFANVEAPYSGASYFEELFLPTTIYNKLQTLTEYEQPIEDVSISELDGKHSETTGGVIVEYMDEEDLKRHRFLLNDGLSLFYKVLEELPDDYEEEDMEELDLLNFFYNDAFLHELQEDARSFGESEDLTITINKKDKKKVLSLINDFVIR